MKVPDLQQKIAQHQDALATLGGRVDQVLARVEILTREAHEFLAEYQEKKRAAGENLGAAGRQFLNGFIGKQGRMGENDLEVRRAILCTV